MCWKPAEGKTNYCATHNRLIRKAEEEEIRNTEKREKALNVLKSKQSLPRKTIKKVSDKMKANPHKHKEIYWKYFGYDPGDFIACEVCGNESVDIHHIDARGMGGDPNRTKDVIENLQALCRPCHDNYGDKTEYMSMLITIHARTMRPKSTI